MCHIWIWPSTKLLIRYLWLWEKEQFREWPGGSWPVQNCTTTCNYFMLSRYRAKWESNATAMFWQPNVGFYLAKIISTIGFQLHFMAYKWNEPDSLYSKIRTFPVLLPMRFDRFAYFDKSAGQSRPRLKALAFMIELIYPNQIVKCLYWRDCFEQRKVQTPFLDMQDPDRITLFQQCAENSTVSRGHLSSRDLILLDSQQEPICRRAGLKLQPSLKSWRWRVLAMYFSYRESLPNQGWSQILIFFINISLGEKLVPVRTQVQVSEVQGAFVLSFQFYVLFFQLLHLARLKAGPLLLFLFFSLYLKTSVVELYRSLWTRLWRTIVLRRKRMWSDLLQRTDIDRGVGKVMPGDPPLDLILEGVGSEIVKDLIIVGIDPMFHGQSALFSREPVFFKLYLVHSAVVQRNQLSALLDADRLQLIPVRAPTQIHCHYYYFGMAFGFYNPGHAREIEC